MNKFYFSKLVIPVFIFAFVAAALAQNTVSLTADDYARAEKFMGYNTSQLIDHGSVRANWLADERFWYRTLTPQGSEFVLVNPANGARTAAFDQTKLAAALSTASGGKYTASSLPFFTFGLSPDGNSISVVVAKKSWKCDIQAYACSDVTAAAQTNQNGVNGIASPDGKRTAFIKDWNLWVRDNATGKDTQLTTDGIKDFGYATDNAGWKKSDRPVLMWSPDSRKIATFQQDQRNVSDMYLVSTNAGAPRLSQWKYPLPTDKEIVTISRVIIDIDSPKVVRLAIPPDQHRSTLCDDISCSGDFTDVEWSEDAKTLAFVSTTRDHKQAKFRVADASTGAVREVFEETSPTQYESGWSTVNWRYLPATNEVLWFSERDGWGHLYLYDLTTGKVKNQITTGEWVVTEVENVDAKNRTIYFLAGGRETGRNPYFSHLYKIGMDGKNLRLLTPEDGNHNITWSPSGRYFIDSYSKQDVPPTSVLRDADGKLIATLEKTDISRLTATGWKPPTPIVVKARDGETDLYGLMWTPTNLDTKKKYPIVNYIYPGPQGGSIGGAWSFTPAFGDNQALAELGFVVVAIEGTCNPLRSKKFHDACYGNMADNTLEDQITGMKQLAGKYPFIDLDKVGIWGHSGGGFATAAAMFRYPDFFKVGISESGNHDNRNYEDDWGERYVGLLTQKGNEKSNYELQANQLYAKNLKGKLLLAHGTMDDNVPPYNTLLVVEELIKANKDFDLIMLPNQRHGYGNASLYMMRRRWDYFVRYLLGANPPPEYELKQKTDPRNTFQ
ncbi:MAG TPA: DPP IV N-terminal domain-containing protein [Pyrinomonadaceae bacterium]|jgi:dipeptidyl aminopeptidase/acylaminoacyl peptidase